MAKNFQILNINSETMTWQQNRRQKKGRGHNSTYTQAEVSCFVGRESSKFKVQLFVGSSVVKIPTCAKLQTVPPNLKTLHKRDNMRQAPCAPRLTPACICYLCFF
jgi:hypothetical protein